MKTWAVRTTSPAAAAAKSTAGTTAPVRRTATGAGRMRSNVAHGEARPSAMPTPNWKNATPITANTVNEAMTALASAVVSASPSPRKTSIRLGIASVPAT